MTDKEFCKLYNSFTGEGGMMSGLDSPKQLTEHRFTGLELKEFIEHCFASQFKGISKEKIVEIVRETIETHSAGCTSDLADGVFIELTANKIADEILASYLQPSEMPSKDRIAQLIEYRMKEDERVHGKSEAIDWIKLSAHRIASELSHLSASRVSESDKPAEISDEQIEGCSEVIIINYLTHDNPNGDYKESTIGADDKRTWWVKGAKAYKDGTIQKWIDSKE